MTVGVVLIRNLIGVDLSRRDFTSFTQDQLYTVLSAVGRRENGMLRLRAGEGATVLLPQIVMPNCAPLLFV